MKKKIEEREIKSFEASQVYKVKYECRMIQGEILIALNDFSFRANLLL